MEETHRAGLEIPPWQCSVHPICAQCPHRQASPFRHCAKLGGRSSSLQRMARELEWLGSIGLQPVSSTQGHCCMVAHRSQVMELCYISSTGRRAGGSPLHSLGTRPAFPAPCQASDSPGVPSLPPAAVIGQDLGGTLMQHTSLLVHPCSGRTRAFL